MWQTAKSSFQNPENLTENSRSKRGLRRKQGEAELYRDLFGNGRYNKWIRPVEHANMTVKVYFELYIAQLIKVDEVSQIMETKLWLRQAWTDYKLKWNQSEYDNITNIRVPSESIWRPDIVLYNTAMGDFHVKQNTKAVVDHNGKVYWMPPAILKSSCSIDVTYFPFDAQNCTMKFGAWTHDQSRIDLKMVKADANQDEFWESGEWEILDAKGIKHERKYNCCPGTEFKSY